MGAWGGDPLEWSPRAPREPGLSGPELVRGCVGGTVSRIRWTDAAGAVTSGGSFCLSLLLEVGPAGLARTERVGEGGQKPWPAAGGGRAVTWGHSRETPTKRKDLARGHAGGGPALGNFPL